MTAFDHFQSATVLIASGCMIAAQQTLLEAIRWIDRTGKDAHTPFCGETPRAC